MTTKIQAIRGMEDVLPDAAPLWEKLEDACRDVLRQFLAKVLRVRALKLSRLELRACNIGADNVHSPSSSSRT